MNAHVAAARMAARNAFEAAPSFDIGTVQDGFGASNSGPSSVTRGGRDLPYDGMVQLGFGDQAKNFGQNMLFLTGDTPMVVGRSPYAR